MNRKCSLRLDLIPGEPHAAWQVFDRLTGANGGMARMFPLPHPVDVGAILASFNHDVVSVLNTSGNQTSLSSLRAWGSNACAAIFPEEIRGKLASYESGDILFMVPLAWADLPFEILCLQNDFLGVRFHVGTIISTGAITGPEKLHTHDNAMLIITDPSGNILSATREGVQLKALAIKKRRLVRLIKQADCQKLTAGIPEASIVHFAGHSGPDHEYETAGWRIGKGTYFDTNDISNLKTRSLLPWLVFSNSCDGGKIVVNTGLSGIAGAFLSAGVSQFIGPFCKLDDMQAAHCSVSFYTHLFNNKCPSQALALLRKKQKNNSGATALFYRLFGDPRYSEHSKKQRRFKKRYLLGALLLILVLFAAGLNRSANSPNPLKPEGWIEVMKAYQSLEALLATEDLEKGAHYVAQNKFGKALEHFNNASDTLETLRDEMGLIICYNHIGALYRELGTKDSAHFYYRQALKRAEKLGEDVLLAVCLKNIGDIFRDAGKNDTAMDYYRRSLAINSRPGTNDEAIINLEIGSIFKFSVNLFAPTFTSGERNVMQKSVHKDTYKKDKSIF